MNESTNTLLYTATYVFIFVIALSLSIMLFLGINRYANSAYEYSQGLGGSIINTVSDGTEMYDGDTQLLPLTREDVLSYYFNYIKKDLYGGQSNNNADVKYDVNIVLETERDNICLGKEEESKNLTNSQVEEKLRGYNKFYLEYEAENPNTKIVYIKIRCKK